MTEALQAAIKALNETDHTRLPAHMVAEIVLRVAEPALRRELVSDSPTRTPRLGRPKLRAI